jgi:protein SCO1
MGYSGISTMNFARMIVVLALLYVAAATPVSANDSPLPQIGPAPSFMLTTQNNAQLKLTDLRGKVVAVTFIFTTCKDTCPVLTAKLVSVQKKLSAEINPNVAFIAISLTPKHDTPDVLKAYANAHNADLSRWSFLTGDAKQIQALAKQYGVFVKAKKTADDVDHGFLTSIVDRAGVIRVQYMGVRFEVNELLADLQSLVQEPAAP